MRSPALFARGPECRPAVVQGGCGFALGLCLLGALASSPAGMKPALAQQPPRHQARQEAGGATEPGGLPATVLSVGDGDTLRVNQAGQVRTIRLACIDAPEMAQRPWGEAARAYLQTRLPRGTAVTLLPHITDRYGRTVAEVIHEININLVLVEDGQAFAYRRYLGSCDAREYLDAEFRASRHRAGVWQLPGGITRPWLFRQLRRGQALADRPGAQQPAPSARASFIASRLVQCGQQRVSRESCGITALHTRQKPPSTWEPQ
ncbi:MAG: thermonuclease family protein [Cyanobium sp.]